MTDLTIERVVDECLAYWVRSGIRTLDAREMAAELRSHLRDAVSADKPIDAVTGREIEGFAKEWAEAFDETTRSESQLKGQLTNGTTTETAPRSNKGLWAWLAAIILLIVAIAIIAPRDTTSESSEWVSTWLIVAGVLAIGEMLTAGFFLLPFAVGATVTGLLATLSVNVATQIIAFITVSVMSLWLLQRFAVKEVRGELLPVGAARYIGSTAVTTEPINRLQSGRVMMGSEDWRATTDVEEEIHTGIEVRVVGVRGAKLVVEPADR